MIKTISVGKFLNTTVYGGSTVSPYNSSPNTGGTGMVRFNPSSATIETYDGSSWVNISGHYDINLTDEAKELLEWAKKERDRQERIEVLAKSNVTIADALKKLDEAKEQLAVLQILVEEENKND